MTSALTAGAASAVITPPVGTAMEGYGARTDVSQGVHDHLHARAIVIDDGDSAVAIVACDLVGVERKLVASARRLASEATGLPEDHILIAATHTHAGPVGLMLSPDDPLVDNTAHRIAEAITEAHAARRPAVLKIGATTVDSVQQNRRHPDWPIDPTLSVLLLDDPDPLQPPIASTINFACHATVLDHTNLLFSADYPGYAMRTVQQLFPGIGVQFLNGACGNVHPAWIVQDCADAERVGTIVGAAAARLIAELRPLGNNHQIDNIRWSEHVDKPVTAGELIGDVRIRAAGRRVDMPLKSYLSQDEYETKLDGLQAQLDALGDSPDPQQRRPIMEQVTRFRTERDVAARMAGRAALVSLEDIGSAGGAASTLHPELMAVSFSPRLALLGLPGEWFVETIRDIRGRANVPNLPVACYANRYVGYVVPPSAYDEGGFEPGIAFLAPEAERIGVDAALSLLQEVMP